MAIMDVMGGSGEGYKNISFDMVFGINSGLVLDPFIILAPFASG